MKQTNFFEDLWPDDGRFESQLVFSNKKVSSVSLVDRFWYVNANVPHFSLSIIFRTPSQSAVQFLKENVQIRKIPNPFLVITKSAAETATNFSMIDGNPVFCPTCWSKEIIIQGFLTIIPPSFSVISIICANCDKDIIGKSFILTEEAPEPIIPLPMNCISVFSLQGDRYSSSLIMGTTGLTSAIAIAQTIGEFGREIHKVK